MLDRKGRKTREVNSCRSEKKNCTMYKLYMPLKATVYMGKGPFTENKPLGRLCKMCNPYFNRLCPPTSACKGWPVPVPLLHREKSDKGPVIN
jgi:hypothetical protein